MLKNTIIQRVLYMFLTKSEYSQMKNVSKKLMENLLVKVFTTQWVNNNYNNNNLISHYSERHYPN